MLSPLTNTAGSFSVAGQVEKEPQRFTNDTGKSIWQKIVDFVCKLLGFTEEEPSWHDQDLHDLQQSGLTDPLERARQKVKDFKLAHPAGAMDEVVTRFVGVAELNIANRSKYERL